MILEKAFVSKYKFLPRDACAHNHDGRTVARGGYWYYGAFTLTFGLGQNGGASEKEGRGLHKVEESGAKNEHKTDV